jgi:hypothetical protein
MRLSATVSLDRPTAFLSLRAPFEDAQRFFDRVFGPNFPDLFRRAAAYVDKILHSAKPAGLPSSSQPSLIS